MAGIQEGGQLVLTSDIENFPGRDKTGIHRRFSYADANPGPSFLLTKIVIIWGGGIILC